MHGVTRVAAGLVQQGGRLLLARRGPGMDMAGSWEFPGGKLEADETPEQALVRELEEELGVRVAAIGRVGESSFERHGRRFTLVGIAARITEGTPVAREHAELRWVTPGEVSGLSLAPADVPLFRDWLRDWHGANQGTRQVAGMKDA